MGDSSIGGEELCGVIFNEFFYHNSVSGLKVETDWKNNYGKNRGGLEISIIL